MAQKAIGRTFGAELRAANVPAGHYSWHADGTFEWFDTSDQIKAEVLAVYAAHDPSALPTPGLTISDLTQLLVSKGVLQDADVSTAIQAKSISNIGGISTSPPVRLPPV